MIKHAILNSGNSVYWQHIIIGADTAFIHMVKDIINFLAAWWSQCMWDTTGKMIYPGNTHI